MGIHTRYIQCEVRYEPNLRSTNYDGVILVSGTKPGNEEPEPFKSCLAELAEIDGALFKKGAVAPINLPAKRLIYSPTGPINLDYDDVRNFAEAAGQGIKRALQAGVKNPLLVLLPDSRFQNVELVTLLGALEALYVPLEVREIGPEKAYKARSLGVWSPSCPEKIQGVLNQAVVMESGRYVAKDIGHADPERMAPPRVEEYVRELFHNSSVCIETISDPVQILEDYPLFACVNRAASVIPRHAGRIMYLTYEPSDPSCVKETIVLIGKGVTFDTGGADIKTGGNMAGMARDKCGAAAVVGFLHVVNLLKPQNIRVVGGIGLVRNSCGENAYVQDEVVTAKCGSRVRVTNTDAEGRMIMADIIYHLKEKYKCSPDPHFLTLATLTAHAKRTVGVGYSIAMDNAVARERQCAKKMHACGEIIGDPVEVSIIRKEDFAAVKGKLEGDDIMQSASRSSGPTRGHQYAAAFLTKASGLDKHGKESELPLKYTHMDIAPSAGIPPDPATGAPVVVLTKNFLGQMLKELENCRSENDISSNSPTN